MSEIYQKVGTDNLIIPHVGKNHLKKCSLLTVNCDLGGDVSYSFLQHMFHKMCNDRCKDRCLCLKYFDRFTFMC